MESGGIEVGRLGRGVGVGVIGVGVEGVGQGDWGRH